MSNNQFSALQDSELAVSQNRVQGEDSLVNMRTTRIESLQVARQVPRAEDQVILLSEGLSTDIVPPVSENCLAFFNSMFVKNFELETSNLNDAMYISTVKDVDGTKDLVCNERISCAGRNGQQGD